MPHSMPRTTTVHGAQWCRTFVPRPHADVRLICFPHAGGSASVFRGWAERLPDSVEVVAVQYPGRQDRIHEEPISDMGQLTERLVEALAPQFDRPVAFFGHSLGATVAFEVARELHPRFPTPLRRLVASARLPPGKVGPSGYDFTRDDHLRRYLRSLGGRGGMALHNGELWQVVVPPLRSDLLMSQRYAFRQGAPLTCPITVIVADGDTSCNADDVRGWARYSLGAFDEHVIPGDHYYVEDPPDELFGVLTDVLDAGR